MVMPNSADQATSTAAGAGTEGGRRPTVVPAPAAVDPELTGSRKRRTFTAKEKLRILAETDAAAGSGDIGTVLRREGIYSSVLNRWRRQRDSGAFNALSPAKRGPKLIEMSPDAEDNRRLRTENARLKERLARAETIIDFQKKVSELLAIPLNLPNSDRDG